MSERPVVLIVDDDPDLRLLAQMQLSDRFDVISVDSGPECLRVARERRPDVILLDMMMPGMDGVEVMGNLAADEKTTHIPVIFLSALVSPDDRVRGLDIGAVDYISKPANPKEFVSRVAAAARTHARHESLRAGSDMDALTGLPDRKAFETRLAQEVARSRRVGTPMSVMIFDVDGMKTLNDRLGQEAGDAILRRMADALTSTLRASDVLFRYGGDELAAVLPDAEAGTAYLAAERCRAVIRSLGSDQHDVSCSIGISESTAGRSVEELLAKAEIALFRAKESGGDRAWRSDDPRRHSLAPIALAEELTEREWTVLKLLADKRTEQDIARRMGIRPGTVRSHKARIRRKLNVSPEMRLSEFVKDNFRDLVARIGEIDIAEENAET